MNNKVNFTKEHQEKLDQFVLKMWKENIIVFNTMNVPMNICDLKELTPNSLNNLKLAYDKKIQALESRDEWVDPENDKIDLYRFIREGLNLLVGYKRKNIEIAENEAKKKQLDKTIAELEESQKTPEDKLKELKAQRAALDEF